ncbi:MAG: hypothetical protein IJ310_05825, partial [Clostridia bacterium]|nr:hypothetical protein [Clostridia bacterium]
MEEEKNVKSNEKDTTIAESNKDVKKMTVGKILLVIFGSLLILGGFIAVLLVAAIKDSKENFTYHNIDEEFVFYDLNYTVESYEIPHSFGSVWPENENNLLCFINMKVYNSTNSKIILRDYFTSNINYILVCDGIEYSSTKYGYSDDYLLYHDDIDARETV